MISLLIVDDDEFIRESLKVLIAMDSKIKVVGCAANGADAVALMSSGLHVDVVLMDIRMPVCDGVEGTKQIKKLFPNSRVLMLTTFDDDEFIIQALENGASGYLLKNIAPDRITQGIKTVHNGDILIHPDVARKLTGFLRHSVNLETRTQIDLPNSQTQRDEILLTKFSLTPMEITIVHHISEGLSNKEIAQACFLSEGTVKNYITEILGKLQLRDRTQIVIHYLKAQTS
ncbi:response regulator transcription factor [Paenibacillus crassostreae]|uniref:LuxR family transcriptional regulator n=1 Tax=Paenibacillus crassostreae TaxID=1763538 RepID=A0A167E2Z7_9BACL|nr:response regulator transcription factor [Paenibacillus crassostreae]AOZ93274.1 DNA-binding response regulator [Paenibacillus crassostreae]OAB75081.1 LuxR family transcriptional regulator [Paenibacillus crassostreae]